uniref:Gypsy retrotransposon integrase-like protein 1 n=1 Tax=Scleropages formosus TaxID=113540 RepID=A0A8C9TDM7_SCLFO
MARRIVAFVDDDGKGDGVPLGLLGDDSVTIQHLAAQVKKLQQQVDMLTSAFSMSVDLQHSLLQQLEIQTSSHSQGPDTHAHPMFTSTPATRTLTKRNSRDAEDSQHSHGQDAGAHPGHTSLTAAHTLSECTARSCPHPPLVSSAHLSGLVPPKFDGGDSIDPEDWLQSVSLYKTAVGLPDTRFFLELTRLFEREPRKWYSAMQPHLLSWEHFSDLFRQAFLPTDNEEKIWRGILDSVQASDESLPTFVAHLVTEFKRLRQPPSEQEQIEVICRHVSDQYRLALHAAAPTTLTELLLTAHELHAALGPISPNRTATSAQLAQRPNLHCYKCFTPGVTTRNCGTCRKTRQSGNTEPGGGAAASPQADQENPNAPQDTRGDPGARPRRFQRPRGGNQNLEPGPSVQSTGGSHSVNLVQDSPRKSKNSPLSSVVMVNQVFLKATLDTGASISAVHPSTLLRCGINEDIVLPWTFSPLELADSKQCTPSGVVWLPVSLLGHLFTHRFAVIPDLSCPILLGTDFMIQADVHIHPATGNVRLGDNANYAPDLGLLEGEFGDLEGHVACLTFKDTKVDFIPVLDQAALLPADKERLASLLRDFEYLFSGKLGKTSLVAHIIDTGTAKPVCLPPYRASPAKRKIIEEQISKMLEDDIIEPASGPWASPIVIVEKPGTEPRFCVDFRKVNKCTVRDSYPLPRVDDSLDFLARGKFISTLDLARGYWQVSLAADSRPKSAFISHKGLYQFKVMPFGLSNAPATFQRLMNTVLAGLTHTCCMVYLDDIVVASPTFDQHLTDLASVLGRLAEAGLSLKLAKCHFCTPKLRYLGYLVTPGGIGPDESKVAAIKQFPTPRTVKNMRQFLGLTSYYRRFISGYARIAEPMFALLREDAHFTWSPECQQSFDHLKLRLTRAPVLVLPNFGKPFTVHTDACDVGLGAALTQTGEDGLERAVAFASRTLHKSERLYSTSEKECLGVIWALEHFRPYVEGSYVTVVTDHNSLRWLMSRPSPSGRLARWCLRLQDFDFEVVHRPGSANLVPDALSRNPACDPTEPVDLLPSYATIGSLNLRRQPLLILEDKQQLKSLQQGDQVIASLFTELESGSCVDSTDFCIQDGLVYFMDKRASCRLHPLKALRFYVPGLLRGTLLRYFHDHPMGGHLGITKTLGRLQRRVYWPGMRGDVKRYVQSCVTCQLSKPANQKPGGYLKPVVATYPWEFAGVDFMGPLPRSGRGNEYILVFIDYFTKWVEICPVREAIAATAARKFVSEVFARHGAPAHLVSDRGVQFVSDFFEEVVAAMGSDHRLTTAYHPQSNQTERVNRTIKTAIRAYVGRKHRDWDLHLPLISFALRTAPHQSTGDTPAFLLYGRDLNTPLDLWLSPSPQYMADSVADYKVELTSALREAYDHVRESLAESQSTQKKHYDKNRRAVSFQVGDLVKLKAHPRSDASAGFSAKLAPVYKGPYRITKVLSELNYKLSRVADAADGGVHHVSNLLPFFTWDDKEDLECLPQQLAETNLQEQEACVPDEQDVFGFDTLFTEPAVHDQLAAAPTVGAQPPSVNSPVVTPPVNFSSPRADAHLQHPQLVHMHTHPYFLRSGCAGDSCLTYAQPFHAETRSFSQHPTHPTQPAHTAHPYFLRPRRTPRVTSGWDVNRWTNPYFALQFGF